MAQSRRSLLRAAHFPWWNIDWGPLWKDNWPQSRIQRAIGCEHYCDFKDWHHLLRAAVAAQEVMRPAVVPQSRRSRCACQSKQRRAGATEEGCASFDQRRMQIFCDAGARLFGQRVPSVF